MKAHLCSLFILAVIFITLSCAKQTSPTGGPQDSIPPKLISSVPENKQINYKSKILTLTFSEDVIVNNAKEELIITPSLGKDFKMTSKGKNITLDLGADPRDSTTYSISFRESVQDITEKNPARNLKIAFSSGTFIDSISVRGKVTDLRKATPAKNITVGLYNNPDTFDIFKHKPFYFTKVSDKGTYSIENIKAGNYFIYAFDDKNKNLIVDSKLEAYGFLKDTIDLHSNKKNINIGLIRLDARKLKLASARPYNTYFAIKTSKGFSSYTVKPSNPEDSLVTMPTANNTTINVYPMMMSADSMKVNFLAIDSLDFKIDTTLYVKLSTRKAEPEKFSVSVQKINIYETPAEIKALVNFSKPLSTINFDSILYQVDSAAFLTFDQTNLLIKSVTQLELVKKVDKKTIFPQEEKETKPTPGQKQKKEAKPSIKINKLIFGKGAFISLENDSSKHIETSTTLNKPEETGILTLEIETKNDHFIVELMEGNDIVQTITDKKKITFNNLIPGQYKIRVIEDRNANKHWDIGSYYQRKEPEKIYYYTTEKGIQEISIKANWEVGPLLITVP